MAGETPSQLAGIDLTALPHAEQAEAARMLRAAAQARRDAVNREDREAWEKVRSRGDWERFTAPRVAALRRSLGPTPAVPRPFKVHVSGSLDGTGFRIENLVYESRPGVWVTANLYLPEPLRARMPGIILIHSHHNPKTQGELQDMGMTWARAGCMVLVPDQPGYGERRSHTPGNRQDYRFRYVNGIQLHTLGESLIGWMAWDTMRGIDLLLGRPGADPERLVLIGSVAGGGDPAAVVAALDPRVKCAVPFNFGGPQPESPYPLPADAETSFDYLGSAYWESTRNLRLSGRDGFLPWVIVGSLAPRRLIYAHEFSWDRERDPVWKRLERIWSWYGAGDRLDHTTGAGVLSGQPPEATHCNNVGAFHRRRIHTALARWFGIPVPEEFQARRSAEELTCLTPELTAKLKPRPAHQVYLDLAAARTARASPAPEERRRRLRRPWAGLLGDVEPREPTVRSTRAEQREGFQVECVALEVEPGITVPLALLLPLGPPPGRRAVVVGVCQEGKERFLRERSREVGELLRKGVAVCLPDVRGTGETAPQGGRGFQSEATSLSAAELMLGRTMLGLRLRDLRSVLRYLRTRKELDSSRLALWGESFAPANPAGLRDPLIGEEPSPAQSEPLGGLLALFGGLYEDDVRAIAARGTLAGFESLLRDRYCYIPHDAVVPGALTAGDLGHVAACLAPRSLRLEGLVDGRNVRVPVAEAQRLFAPAVDAYRLAPDRLSIGVETAGDLVTWLVGSLVSR